MLGPFFWMLQPSWNDEQTDKAGTKAENTEISKSSGKHENHTDLSTLQALYQPPYSPNGEPSFCFPFKTKEKLITRLSLTLVYNKTAPGTLLGLTCCKPVHEAWTPEYIIWSDSCVHRLTLTLFITSGFLIPSKITWRIIKRGDYCCVRVPSRNKPFKPWRK